MRFGLHVPPHERRPVAWFAPQVLWQAARKLLAAEQFASHLDRRETFAADLQPIDLSADAGPFWFDFASDTGDGGDATFAVAQALLAPDLAATAALDEAGRPLPQGRLLLLGGDLAYPGSGRLDYQYRFIEPFEQAQAWAGAAGRWRCGGGRNRLGEPLAADEKLVLAIPQNHDWAVSCSAFCRYFVNHDRGAVLGARTPQRQTWFAAKLPRNWWVLGLDFALEGDLDRNQYEGFRALINATGAGIGPGSQLLLVYPEPYWTRPLGDGAPEGYPKRYQRLEAQLLAAGAQIRLRLAGDLHHYAHDRLPLADGSDTHLVVAGHGGAFTHATHTLDAQAPRRLREAKASGGGELAGHVEIGLGGAPALPAFEPQARYPAPLPSRLQALGAWWQLLRQRAGGRPRNGLEALQQQWDSNRGLLPLMGGGVALLTWFGWGIKPDIDLNAVPSASVVLPALALFAAASAALYDPLAKLRSLLLGGVHGLAQLAAAWLLTLVCFQLHPGAGWPAFIVGAGLASGLLLGSALALASGVFGLASNACSGLVAHEGHKGFLRFRLDDEGLTVFALGLDEVPARHELPAAGTPLPAGWRVVERFRVCSH